MYVVNAGKNYNNENKEASHQPVFLFMDTLASVWISMALQLGIHKPLFLIVCNGNSGYGNLRCNTEN